MSSSAQRRTPRVKSSPRAARTRRDHLEREAHAVVEAAAVLVAAEVGERRHELPRQRAVAELQFHAVEAALAHVHCRAGEVVDDLADVLDLHGLGRLPVEHVRDGRRRPHRQAGKAAAALLAVVVELGEDARVVPVDFAGELLVAGDHLGMEGFDEPLVGPVGGMHRLLFGDDEPRAAARAGRQVARQPLAGQPVLGQVGEVGRERDAVRDRHAPYLQRTEQVRELRHLRPRFRMKFHRKLLDCSRRGFARGASPCRRRAAGGGLHRAKAFRVGKAHRFRKEISHSGAAAVTDREAVAPAAGFHLEIRGSARTPATSGRCPRAASRSRCPTRTPSSARKAQG